MSDEIKKEERYDADNISVLEGLDAVRERPAMYIGSTDINGLHHLVYEVVDNSIDEAMAGYCETIEVTIQEDGSVQVSDDGRGIPVSEHPEKGLPAVEVILTTLHAGGKFDSNSYKVSGGLHGVGISVVNALAQDLEVDISRDGYQWKQTYSQGIPDKPLQQVAELGPDDGTGTTITFKPDSEIFETLDFEFDVLAERLRELAFLNPGVSIVFRDERVETESNDTDDDSEEAKEVEYTYEGGIKEYVEFLNEAKKEIHPDVIYFEGDDEDLNIEVEIAMQATQDIQNSIRTYANNIHTPDGGTHLTGFKTALTRVVNDYAGEHNLLKDIDGENLTGEDVREGLTAVISVKHPDPQFEGQTKVKLGNRDVRGVVESTVHEGLGTYFEENPNIAQSIVDKAVEAAKARKEAQKAQEVARKSATSTTALPGKLADCQTKDPDEAELFIVEGDSAGGSAKQGRNPAFQAILPLRGKILNVERHRLDRALENDQINTLVTAIGGGVGDDFSIEDCRYRNIIFATDADVDGAHIRTLLLTVIYRYMRPLLEHGCVYAIQPPLYRIRYRGETYDAMDEAERERIIEEKCNGNPTQVQRFKGLGEMDAEDLWDTCLNPENRNLKQITLEEAERAERILSILMGSEVGPRKEFIKDHANEAEWIDI